MHCVCDVNGVFCLSFYDNNLSTSYTNSVCHDNGEYGPISIFNIEAESLGYALRGRTLPNIQLQS